MSVSGSSSKFMSFRAEDGLAGFNDRILMFNEGRTFHAVIVFLIPVGAGFRDVRDFAADEA